MKRYNLTVHECRKGHQCNDMAVYEDGEWVKYADAQATVEALQKKYDDLLGKYRQLVDFYDKHNGTPCEQIRHQQQVEALQRENACKDTLIETLQAQLAQRGKDGGNE